VLTVTTFSTEDEAVALANGTDYALIGANSVSVKSMALSPLPPRLTGQYIIRTG
jgi:hypothetical protein